MLGNQYFSKENSGIFIDRYGTVCQKIVEEINEVNRLKGMEELDVKEFPISKINLARAMHEMKSDMNIIQFRRKPKEISQGKLAGIICFRLTRWNPVIVGRSMIENKTASSINIIAAHSFCKKHVLNLPNIGGQSNFGQPDGEEIKASAINNEIVFMLRSRHVNQETLGIVYDTILHYC